jgi:tetratricopeptide (TPR) repeat protein
MIAATIGILSVGFSSSALAQTAACSNPKISKQIAKQMSAAQDAMKAKKWQDSLNKMKEAEAVPGGKSAFDLYTMSQFRAYIYASTRQEADAARELENQLNSPCMPEAKKGDALKNLVGLYTALRNYPKAIEYGNRALKASPNDTETKVAVAQAYYQSGNNKDAVRLMNEVLESSGRPKENQLLLIQAACSKAGNNACVTQVFEKLVVNYPKTEYWSNLMDALRHGDNNDVQQLNVFRLSNQVNVMKRADEFKEYAQLAIDENLACEAQSVLEQGFTKKAFVEKRDVDVNTRLLNTAKTKCIAEKAAVAAAENAAAQQPSGDALVKAGAQQLMGGNAAKASEDIQKGITKGKLASRCRYAASAAASRPSRSLNTAALCWPSSGAGERIELGVADRRGATFCMRKVPNAGWVVFTMACRAMKCGSSSMSAVR